MNFNIEKAKWFNEPKNAILKEDKITISTDGGSDFWQRTYYGFQNDNAHVLYVEIDETYFTLEAKVTFNTNSMFDQCGLCIYQDSETWMKSGIEYHNEKEAWMGSVVTNHGYSDWATTMVDASIKTIWYRLSRRESDFLIENSFDGETFNQMRIFHMFDCQATINVGLLACSPMEDGGFDAVFEGVKFMECLWNKHE